MKRLIIVTVVIALVAVAVFGGQALAGKPTGSSVAIETDEFSITVLDDITSTSVNYPQVRHVSLTVFARGIVSSETVAIWLWMPDNSNPVIDTITANGFHTYEFDSDNFHMRIEDGGGTPITVSYYVTTTYER